MLSLYISISLILFSIFLILLDRKYCKALATLILSSSILLLILCSISTVEDQKTEIDSLSQSLNSLDAQLKDASQNAKNLKAEKEAITVKLVTAEKKIKKQLSAEDKAKVARFKKSLATLKNSLVGKKEAEQWTILREKENYKITLTKDFAHPFDVNRFNQFASSGLRLKASKGYSMVISEDLSDLPKLTDTKELLALGIQNLEISLTDPLKSEVINTTIAEHQFSTQRIQGKLKNNYLTYEYSTLIHGRRGYSIVSWTNRRFNKKLSSDHQALLNKFEILDDTKTIQAQSPLPFTSELGFWKLSFDHLAGQPYENSASEYPSSILSRDLGNQVGFLCYEAPVEKEGLTNSLYKKTILRLHGFGDKPIQVNEPIKIGDQSFHWQTANYESAGSPMVCHILTTIFQQHQMSVCLWQPKEMKVNHIKRVLSNLAFFKVPAGKQLTNIQLNRLASIYNQAGIQEFMEEDFSSAIKLYQRAYELAPTQSVYCANITRSLLEQGRNIEALQQSLLNLKKHPNNTDILAHIAESYALLGQHEKALGHYKLIFKSDCNDSDIIQSYINLLIKESKLTEAIGFIKNHDKRFPSSQHKQTLVDLYSEAKQYQHAEKILLQLIANNKKKLNYHYQLAVTYLDWKKFDQALNQCNKTIAMAPDSVPVLLLKATCLREANKSKEAYEFLTELNKKIPGNPQIKKLLARVTANQGFDDTSIVTTPIEAVPLSPMLVKKYEQYSQIEAPREAEFDFITNKKITAVNISPKGYVRTTQYREFVITNINGLNQLKSYPITFNPVSEKLFVNSFSVYNKQGHLSYQGNIKDAYLSDEASDMHTHDKTLNLQFKSLAIGSRISLTYTIAKWVKAGTVPYTEYWLGGLSPYRFSALTYSGAIKNIKYHSTITPNISSTPNKFTAWDHSTSTIANEIYSPDYEKQVCKISVADSSQTWSQVSQTYYQHIAKKFNESEALNTEIRSLLQSGKSQQEKVQAAISWLQNQCTYRAFEFGPRGRMPKDAIETFRGKEGDCKDMSLVLWFMLQELDIECYIALANSNGLVRPTLPSENQFNHVVLYCPTLKNKIIDPTYSSLNILEFAPYNLRNNFILPVTKQGTELVKIDFANAATDIEINRHVKSDNNTIITTDKYRLQGYVASYFRHKLKGTHLKEQKKFFYNIAKRYYPNIEVTDIKLLTSAENAMVPLELEVSYRTEKNVIPVVLEQFYFRKDRIENRQSALHAKFSLVLKSTTTLPASYQISLKNMNLDTPFIEHSIKIKDKTVVQNSRLKSFDKDKKHFSQLRKDSMRAIIKF